MTPCLSTPVASNLESSPVKIWSLKLLPLKKVWIFRLLNAYYTIQFTPAEILNNWRSLMIFWTSSQWILILPPWYYSLWCLPGSRWNHSNLWWLFSWNIELNVLVILDWISFVFTNFLWWPWKHNWNCVNEGIQTW